MFKFLRKKKEEEPRRTPIQNMNRELVTRRHRARMENLSEELRSVGRELKEIELDVELSKSVKAKQSDRIIKRMALIEYETDIRENLLKWL